MRKCYAYTARKIKHNWSERILDSKCRLKIMRPQKLWVSINPKSASETEGQSLYTLLLILKTEFLPKSYRFASASV